MSPTLRTVRTTFGSAWKEATANRRGFWTQVTVMVANDIVWIIFWALFFDRVGDLRGWGLDQIMVLFAVLTTSGGVVLGLFNNVRHIGELASTGGLDSVLALPTSPLLQLLTRRVNTVHLGDLFFGVVLFLVFGNPTPTRFAVFLFGVVCASLIMGGFLVLMGSTSFFVSRNEGADLGFHAILLFSSYPVDIFAGATRIFLYAVVPAGFVTSVPTELVDDFHPGWAAGTAGVAVLVAFLGWAAFTVGLRRYTSGAVWTAA